MKNLRIFRLAFVALLTIVGVTFTSCEDEPDKYKVSSGKPTISYVRVTSPESGDSLLTGAYMETIICIVGDNLRSTVELWFNDQQATLNTSYITDNTLIVAVPSVIPTTVTDMMYFVTSSNDTVTYPFEVIIPAPTLTSMSCEYAPVGSEATIYGNYFIDDENVPLTLEFESGQVVTEFTDIQQTQITFVVPEGAEEGYISVTTIYGTTQSTFKYCDTRGMLFEFDGVTGLSNHGWHDRTILSDETSITGNFVQLGGTATMSADGGYDDSNFSFEYWAGSWDEPQNMTSGDGIALFNVVDFTDYSNMSLKFELYIPSSNPWSAGAMQIVFAGYDIITYSGYSISGYSGTVASPNNYMFNGEGSNGEESYGRALYRPWTSSGSYDTGDEWVTVTIALSDFTLDYVGGNATSVPDSAEDFASFQIFVVGGGVSGTECTPIFKIDNIRVVPNE